eukprot:CAMPEP_0172569678 /NCGR_PEP_ID=MMETSP1067-20121228/124518_1 /TAXON_ID=265564 ORGANISM="Thalassiosira punctigera, Strain Tpunct2005C2" /NCGR_SAMPLE_ID=MMETSP1067 /ASSEMBLY_ACC=CAM_ASM_000444 /LENGTH=180 /DNA_ID=CAMNT_0013361561 /DNA_START=185 /DNA_END=724 /DNA_ORIENTATION=-
MWKPGTAKPNNDAPPKRQSNTSGKGPKAAGGAPKRLSSSTMGMRFMQRKNESKNREREEKKAAGQTAAARQSNGNHATSNEDDGAVGSNDHGGDNDRKRESEEISQHEKSAQAILELASVVDMYGVGSDVVGRRSFGGFRKPVRTTWEAALKRRTDDDERARNTKSHITDEELLERYEKY